MSLGGGFRVGLAGSVFLSFRTPPTSFWGLTNFINRGNKETFFHLTCMGIKVDPGCCRLHILAQVLQVDVHCVYGYGGAL